MTVVRNRAVGAVVTAAACAAVLSTTCTFTSGVRALMAEVGLVSNDGWIMGGTGNPIPDTDYLNSVESLYLEPVPAPEQRLQLRRPGQHRSSSVRSSAIASQPDLGFGDSLNQGVGDLDQPIVPDLQDGNDVVGARLLAERDRRHPSK